MSRRVHSAGRHRDVVKRQRKAARDRRRERADELGNRVRLEACDILLLSASYPAAVGRAFGAQEADALLADPVLADYVRVMYGDGTLER